MHLCGCVCLPTWDGRHWIRHPLVHLGLNLMPPPPPIADFYPFCSGRAQLNNSNSSITNFFLDLFDIELLTFHRTVHGVSGKISEGSEERGVRGCELKMGSIFFKMSLCAFHACLPDSSEGERAGMKCRTIPWPLGIKFYRLKILHDANVDSFEFHVGL